MLVDICGGFPGQFDCLLRLVERIASKLEEPAPSASTNSAMVPCQHKFFASTEFGFVECRYCGETYPIEAQHQ